MIKNICVTTIQLKNISHYLRDHKFMYLKYISNVLILILFLFACGDDLTQAKAPKLSVSATQILFPSPELGKNESEYRLKVSNEGNADLLIVRTAFIENNHVNGDSEFAILDEDDWNNRLLIKAGQSKDLRLTWKPLDDNQDHTTLEIESNDGTVQVEINTVDLDPNILILSTNPSISIENENATLFFTQAMYGFYQKAVIEIRPDSPVPLILKEICLINDGGDCMTTYPTSDEFFLCDTAQATKENCSPIPNQLPVLAFDENYKFSLFFHVIDQRDSGFYGNLRIKSNASETPDALIALKGNACTRDELNPICQKCGDGRVDADSMEECDDGNFVDLDGCGLNCKTTEISCVDGTLGCPCRTDGNQACDLGFSCDAALRICVSCSGQVGCPCPCNAQSTCNEETGICEMSHLEDAFLMNDMLIENSDMDIQDQLLDMHIDTVEDMAVHDMYSLDMQIALDQSINDDFSVDMMMIDILGISHFFHQHLVQGAFSGYDRNYNMTGILSSGSSLGHSTNYTIQSTLNP